MPQPICTGHIQLQYSLSEEDRILEDGSACSSVTFILQCQHSIFQKHHTLMTPLAMVWGGCHDHLVYDCKLLYVQSAEDCIV